MGAVLTTDGLAALFQDGSTAEPTADAVDWYAGHVPPESGPVLDLGCGSGHLLLALLERGCNVHGVASDTTSLARCEARLRARGRSAPLFRQELAALNLPFRYGMAFLPDGAFQSLLDPVGIGLALERVRAHLIEPGILLLELFTPAVAAHPPGAPLVEIRRIRLDDGATITLRSETQVDPELRRIDRQERYELRRGMGLAGREDQRTALTWYSEDEALHLVREVGFRDVRIEPISWGGETMPHRFAVIALA